MFKIIGSANPKYLAATDLLIGDMSNTNYEFLLFDRPVVLLANNWLTKNFPDIGYKTNIKNLGSTIVESIEHPHEFQLSRKLWLNRTISITEEKASKRYLDIILQKAGIQKPTFILIHGGNSVRKTNLQPLIEEISGREFPQHFIHCKDKIQDGKNIIIGAHCKDFHSKVPGYKVHIDHDLKGVATANLEYAIRDYKKHQYYPHIDLHIVAGKAGEKRTKLVLGPYADRTVVGGYPKGDHLLKLSTIDNKNLVYEELGFKKGIPLVSYAPAGPVNFMKPGGSLKSDVIDKLREISRNGKLNILIKGKYNRDMKSQTIQLLKAVNIFSKKVYDDGSKWRSLFSS